jgi:hypothetical protein
MYAVLCYTLSFQCYAMLNCWAKTLLVLTLSPRRLLTFLNSLADDCGAEDPTAADRDDDGSNDEQDDMDDEEDDVEYGADDKSNVTSLTNNSDGMLTTLDARARLSSLLLLLNGPALGYIVSWLERACPDCLESLKDSKVPESMEINIDAIDNELLSEIPLCVKSMRLIPTLQSTISVASANARSRCLYVCMITY